ncbi:MAG: IS30 family transposase [Candidatus Endonucleobacter sp. (ex Gigantidas childressi)]|nr:IS30 family transposase [Candidatus Endonucleobacter sp. (ex Gigantidas childressi)]
MKLFIDIFGVIKRKTVFYGSTYAALKSEYVNTTRLYDSCSRLANKSNTTNRPTEVATSKTPGHREIDTVMGKGDKHCIITLIERKTGYTLIGQLNDRTPKSSKMRTLKSTSKMPEQFKTITSDNGTEIHQYKKAEEATNCSYYLAKPNIS